MPNVTERRKATQHRAVRKQRLRVARYLRQRRALARLRAEVRRARFAILRRKRLIERTEGVRIVGNRATGGTPSQRLRAVALASAAAHASGRRHSFYSQSGWFDPHHCITGEPRGARSDCSSWVISAFWSAELPDPSHAHFTGGNTDTLAAHGRAVAGRDLKAGDLGFYSRGGRTFHVEMYVGNGRWVGHGSPPVDSLTPGFPDFFRRYT